MISQDYLHLDTVEKYVPLEKSGILLGTRIKNRYDEMRIKINDSYSPKRFLLSSTGDKFYGVTLDCPLEYRSLLENLKNRRPFDLIGYNQLLEEYGLTSNSEFYKLNNFFFPLDYEHITKFLPVYDYSSYLCLESNSARFQSYAQPELIIFFID